MLQDSLKIKNVADKINVNMWNITDEWGQWVTYIHTVESDWLLHRSSLCRAKRGETTGRRSRKHFHRQWGDTQTHGNKNRHTLLGSEYFAYVKNLQWCDAVCLGAVEQNPFSALLANQGGVLLHLRLVARALAFAGVGCVGHDGPSV